MSFLLGFLVFSLEIATVYGQEDPPPNDMTGDQRILWNVFFSEEPQFKDDFEVLTDMWFDNEFNFDPKKQYIDDHTVQIFKDFFNHPQVQERMKIGEQFKAQFLTKIEERVLQDTKDQGYELDYSSYLKESWIRFQENKKKEAASKSRSVSVDHLAMEQMRTRYPTLRNVGFSRWDIQYRNEYRKLVNRLEQQQSSPMSNITNTDFETWLQDEFRKYEKEEPLYVEEKLKMILEAEPTNNLFSIVHIDDPSITMDFDDKNKKYKKMPLTKEFFQNTHFFFLENNFIGNHDYLYYLRDAQGDVWGLEVKFPWMKDGWAHQFEIAGNNKFTPYDSYFAIASQWITERYSFHHRIKDWFRGRNDFGETYDRNDPAVLKNFPEIRDPKYQFPITIFHGVKFVRNRFVPDDLIWWGISKRLDFWKNKTDPKKTKRLPRFPWQYDWSKKVYTKNGGMILNDGINGVGRFFDNIADYFRPGEFDLAPTNSSKEDVNANRNVKTFKVLGKNNLSSQFFLTRDASEISDAKPVDLSPGAKDISIEGIMPLHTTKAVLSIPVPRYHKITSILVNDLNGKEYILGKDYELLSIPGKEGYFMRFFNRSEHSLFINVAYTNASKNFVKENNPPISTEKLQIESKKLSSLGFESLSEKIAKATTVGKLVEILNQESFYTFDREPGNKRGNPSEYKYYSRFVKDGKLYFQCDGANNLFRLIVTNILSPNYDANVVSGYVSEEGYLTLEGHANVEILKDGEVISYVDATPPRFDPQEVSKNKMTVEVEEGKEKSKNEMTVEVTWVNEKAKKVLEALLKKVEKSREYSVLIGEQKPKGPNPGPVFKIPTLLRLSNEYLLGQETKDKFIQAVQKELSNYIDFSSLTEDESLKKIEEWIHTELKTLDAFFQDKKPTRLFDGNHKVILSPAIVSMLKTQGDTFLEVFQNMDFLSDEISKRSGEGFANEAIQSEPRVLKVDPNKEKKSAGLIDQITDPLSSLNASIDGSSDVRAEPITEEENAGIDQFIKVAAEYRSALREKDKIIKESKEQKKSPDTNPAFQTAKDKIEIKYQEMLQPISKVFEGRGFIVSEVNAPNKPKMIGIQPTVDAAANNELTQYPYTDVLWIDPTSMGDYFAQYYQKIVISVMPTGLKGLLFGNLQPLFYHELVHAKTFYKMMNTPDHTIYLNGFAEITHGSDIPSQYRQGLSVDEINAYSDTVRIYMELIQNSASASEIYENIKSLELNTKMLMILSEEIHSNLIKMKLAFYNDDGESISNAIDQYAKSITDFKSADEYQDILIKHVRENHVVNLRFKMDGFTYDAVFKSKEIFELLHQYASTKDQKLKLKIADLAKEILRDDREKIKLLSAHSAEMGNNINEAVKSIIDKIKYKPKDSFDKTKPGVDPRYSLEAIKTDFQEVLEQLQKNVTTVYENTRDGSEPFRKIIGGSSSDKPNSGILSFLGLGEWADRNASDKPGLTRQAWDWVKEKFVSDDEGGGVAVDEALQEEMQKLPTNQDLVDSGLPLEMREDGKLVVREVPVIANTPMSDTQTTGQSKTKTANETSRSEPKTSIAELREIVDGIEKRITTEEKKSYFDSKKERLIALQTELIHDSEHRVEIIRTLGKASVGSRALDQYKSEAIYEAPKYFAAMLLSHAALAVEDKGITFDTFVDLIRGFPKELWSNAVSSVGSAGAVMLFDSFAPLVSKKMANAYQVEIMEQFMIKSKGMNAYQMLRRESNLLRGFTRNQFNMLGANLVSLAAFSDPTMSAEEFCFLAAKMQITFLAAQGIVRGIGINGGLALGGESLKTWLSKVRVSSSKAVVTTVVLFAIDMTVQLLFDDDINRTTTTVLLQKQISDGLKEWIKARKSEDFPYVMQSMMAYWETLVFEPLQKITMKYEGLQDELDADLEFVRMRNYTKSYPKLKGSLPAGKQNAINKLWQNYMAESGQAQKELLDTIDANLIKQIKGLKATRQQLLDMVYECNTTFKPLDQCASEEEELKDRIKRLRAAILSHGKEITMYPNDLDPLSNILKTRVIPKTMTVNEWIKLMIGVAKMAKYQEQEQTLESIMQIAEGQYDVRKTPEKYMALNEQVADGFRRSQVEPYLDPIIGRNVMTIIMDETDTPEAIEKKIRERLMEMAYYNKCAAVGGEFKDGFISQRNQIVNSAAYKAQKSRVESRMMNAYSGEWGIPSDSMDKERVMQMLKTTGAILLMPIIQEKKSNRLGKPYTDDVYTVPVTKGLLGPYQQATTCAQ